MDNIENYSYQELRLIASDLNIPHRSRYNKVELYNELLNYYDGDMLRLNAFSGGSVSNFFKKIVGKCKTAPVPVNTPSIDFARQTLNDNNRQVQNYCAGAIKDLQTLKPTSEQKIAIQQFNELVQKQNSQIAQQLTLEGQTPQARNSLISDISTLGNTCKNIYVPLRQQITKDKCY